MPRVPVCTVCSVSYDEEGGDCFVCSSARKSMAFKEIEDNTVQLFELTDYVLVALQSEIRALRESHEQGSKLFAKDYPGVKYGEELVRLSRALAHLGKERRGLEKDRATEADDISVEERRELLIQWLATFPVEVMVQEHERLGEIIEQRKKAS